MSQFSRKPRTASQALVLDGELLGQIDQLRATLRSAQVAERISPAGLDSMVPKLERQIDELIQQAGDEAVVFTVKAIPGVEFDAIKREHPPTEEQMTTYRELAKSTPWAVMPEMDPSSMGADLLAACLVEPDMSEADIRSMWNELSKGEQNQLWNLALGVQVDGASIPLSRAATGTTDNGGELSTTAPNGGSPLVSS